MLTSQSLTPWKFFFHLFFFMFLSSILKCIKLIISQLLLTLHFIAMHYICCKMLFLNEYLLHCRSLHEKPSNAANVEKHFKMNTFTMIPFMQIAQERIGKVYWLFESRDVTLRGFVCVDDYRSDNVQKHQKRLSI